MTRDDIIDRLRQEVPEITSNVISDSVLASWCEVGDKDFCARTRCIVDVFTFASGTTSSSYNTLYDLSSENAKFYDIDEYPGGGVSYNDERLVKSSIGELDAKTPNWRERSAGTPKKYYRWGKYIGLDRPVETDATMRVYATMISDNFDSADITPFNQLLHLEPFHYGLVKYLEWRAMGKVGKERDMKIAQQEYAEFAMWTKKQLGGGKYAPIYFKKRT